MSVQNPERVVTKQDLADFYTEIRPYLGGGGGASGGIDKSVIAPDFDSTESYTRGNLVWYQDALYECTAAHSGAWDSSHFSNKDLSDIFQTQSLRTPITVGSLVHGDLEQAVRAINNIVPGYAYQTTDEAVTTISDSDSIPLSLSSAAPSQRKITWSYLKSVLKSYFDSYYQKTLTAGTGISISSNTVSTPSMNFTTSEQVVGKWLGSTMYQKTISCGALPNNTTKTVAHGISSISNIVSVSGWSTNGNMTLAFPYFNGTNLAICSSDKTNIRLTTNADVTSYSTTYVTLRYTK